MPVKTSRTNENSVVSIDYSVCNNCGKCARVCKNLTLQIVSKKVIISDQSIFGCIGCGQCVAVCESECISISGREISLTDFYPLPDPSLKTNYESLLALLQSRRSIRDFRDKEISSEDLNKIINAAKTAPMGIPPSDVSLLVLHGREKVNAFSNDFIEHLRGLKKMFTPFMLAVMRIFISKADYEMIKQFVDPLIKSLIKKKDEGENWLLYDAPLAIYFYSSPYSDYADCYIAATYAMLAAESLGIGTCMIGSVDPFLQRGGKKFLQKYGLNNKGKSGLIVIFGYPKYSFSKGIKRSFARISFN